MSTKRGSNRGDSDEVLSKRMATGGKSQAVVLLTQQLKELSKRPVEGFSAGPADDSNLFLWDIMIMGPPGTPYEGGMFKAKMQFPEDFPNSPPELRFTSQFWHPNVHKEDGKVCISILHPPGDDPHHYELAEERWRPIHSIESVLLSVIAMISDPNDESPANVDAAKQWRDNPDEYKKVVGRLVRRSQEEAFD